MLFKINLTYVRLFYKMYANVIDDTGKLMSQKSICPQLVDKFKNDTLRGYDKSNRINDAVSMQIPNNTEDNKDNLLSGNFPINHLKKCSDKTKSEDEIRANSSTCQTEKIDINNSNFNKDLAPVFLIPWGHNREILTKCSDCKEALFYASETLKNGWSRAVLLHFIKSGLYYRQGKAVSNFSACLPETESELCILGRGMSFDLTPAGEDAIEMEDIKKLANYMTETARRNKSSLASQKSRPMTVEKLISANLAVRKSGTLFPTWAYLVILGRSIPGRCPPRIRCRAYEGKDISRIYDQRECEGPVSEQIEEAFEFVCKNMRQELEIVRTRNRTNYELPPGSIREIICNAVCHRSYLEASDIYVAMYRDRLEITSPGGLHRDITLEEAKNGFSKLRNEGLAFALAYMGIVEAWGGGIAKCLRDWHEAELEEPHFEVTPGYFRVVLPRPLSPGDWQSCNNSQDISYDRLSDWQQDKEPLYVEEPRKTDWMRSNGNSDCNDNWGPHANS